MFLLLLLATRVTPSQTFRPPKRPRAFDTQRTVPLVYSTWEVIWPMFKHNIDFPCQLLNALRTPYSTLCEKVAAHVRKSHPVWNGVTHRRYWWHTTADGDLERWHFDDFVAHHTTMQNGKQIYWQVFVCVCVRPHNPSSSWVQQQTVSCGVAEISFPRSHYMHANILWRALVWSALQGDTAYWDRNLS